LHIAPDEFRALSFDLDGTLLDSMGLHYEAYRRVFATRGFGVTRERFDAAVGGPYPAAIPAMVDLPLGGDSVEQIHDEKLAVMQEVIAEVPVLVLPAARLLALHGRMPLALVTSGARSGVASLLARLGWADLFDVVVSGDDVARGKPHPEPYEQAARRLGVPAGTCLALEDSDPGCVSALGAGMTVVDVRQLDGAARAS